ncbi:alpha/beta hydrolase [Halobium salinum]|uniref:Alpha/beta hydrolase n=1 Tax=Halobium salinum TaxID=1364940 RepID=A0ABD5P979_9EURY|nr:alpha/beta fold hydrolase [Halobium salinum]
MKRLLVEREPSRFEFSKVRARFRSDDTECVGWLYRPDRPVDAPVVVMAPGFAAERRWGLPAYAERLAERGYAVYLFDYRGFGDSRGEPRGLVSPKRQLADLRAAITAVRRLDGIDENRLALWGISLSAGHAVRVAAEDTGVDAVVGVTPLLDGRSLVLSGGVVTGLKRVAAGVRDRLQSIALGDHTLPVADETGTAAFVQPGTRAGYLDLLDSDDAWDNELPARSFLSLLRYRPVGTVGDVTCPTLLLGGTRDEVASADSVSSAAGKMPNATYVSLPTDHFGVYHGETFEQVVGHATAFLDANL